ncbi:MAG: trehalose 6-phosphate synthase [Spirochaetota bacterium]
MQSLEGFYGFLNELHTVRTAIVGYYLMQAHTPHQRRSLEHALSAIDELPGGTLDKKLEAGGRETIVTLDYERGELEKDIFFLDHADDEFEAYLAERHDSAHQHAPSHDPDRPAFSREVSDALDFLRDFLGRASAVRFITDRDGTVNNYCGRYRSSHQSIWNAVYLSRFARAATADSVILTSAPLMSVGLLDLTAMPAGTTHYAGSKGREYYTRAGTKGAMEIKEEQAERLKELNRRIDALVARDEYRTFGVIGSGVQHKFGQTTVGRQDIHESIPADVSRSFLEEVRSTVHSLDPNGSVFGIEDTGKDIEITLTADDGHEFTKGDGIAFVNAELDLGLRRGPNLICGDTSSDAPMVEKAVELGAASSTAAVFVTQDDALRERVRNVVPRAHFVTEPDALVLALHRLAAERGAQ